MIRPIRTASAAWLSRHRQVHAQHRQFGTHQHPYLLDTVRELADRFAGAERPSLLDYGCGKGVFLGAMTRSGWFRYTRGYDPAVATFQARPAQQYDIVLCLDVLDQVEDQFVDDVIADVAQLTIRAALFDVITIQTPALAHLNPRSAATWEQLIGQQMRISRTTVRPATEDELRAGACPERAIFVAESFNANG